MDDLIRRQDAIDALWKALYDYEDRMEKQFMESDELDIGDWILHRIFVQNMSDIDRQTILNLPSAQPEYTEQDVRDSFNSGYACGMEAAQSEIIRCRDCRYGVDYYHDGNCYCAKPGYELLYFDGSWDFYCANAERRT